MFITNNFAWQFIPIALITAVFSVVGDLYETLNGFTTTQIGRQFVFTKNLT
jgi:hypothetical protein